ncbi:hypothetical protein B0H17DRAFT_1058493 [Mycena rosella]|uniref:Uncharacterized protein n=1 Tax=Mycena rosella TaxID=1033263 RepID=A0AAD7DLY5_MYCRO|nr:hypothetical protein B0H17DRAFT_1058493 [Mycena rosella]
MRKLRLASTLVIQAHANSLRVFLRALVGKISSRHYASERSRSTTSGNLMGGSLYSSVPSGRKPGRIALMSALVARWQQPRDAIVGEEIP